MPVSPLLNINVTGLRTHLTGLVALVIATSLLVAPSPATAASKQAVCKVTSAGAVAYSGQCTFEPDGGGSFSISTPTGIDGPLFHETVVISVEITSRGVAKVSAITTGGNSSSWGRVIRSSKDRACWDGSNYQICAW